MRIETYLKQSPVYQIHRAARILTASMGRLLADRQVNLLEALVLVSVFFEDPRPVQPSRLAETFSTTRGNISHCVSGLEAKGLLRRQIDPEDSRAFHLALKPQGRKCAMELIRVLDHLQRQLERRIGTNEIDTALSVIQGVERVCGSLAEGG